MYDYHFHTTFSGDSTIDPEEGIQRAIKEGIKEIVVTDHIELNVWRPGDIFDHDMVDLPRYFKTFNHLTEKYKGKIAIKIGLEVGLQVEEKQAIDQLIHSYPLDFVIGSTHTIDKIDLYYGKIYEEDKATAYDLYFNEVLRNVKTFDCYNVYGHLDLIIRYALGKYEDVKISTADMEIVRTILKEIITRGKGIEVNTSGYRYGLNSTNPDMEILKLYRQLGGEIITVGSDAHSIEHLGANIQETYELLKCLGYKYITTFDRMKPLQIKL